METVKCPICDNPGIPDYHSQNVVCPHCGSDLSIYKTLHNITASSTSNKDTVGGKAKLIIAAAIVALCLIASASYISYNISRKPLVAQIEAQNNEMQSLKAALDLAQKEAQEKAVTTSANKSQFIYEVQKNDSPWSIVRKLFGISSDWKKIAQKIAEDNGLWDSSKMAWKEIHPGQKLTINNNN